MRRSAFAFALLALCSAASAAELRLFAPKPARPQLTFAASSSPKHLIPVTVLIAKWCQPCGLYHDNTLANAGEHLAIREVDFDDADAVKEVAQFYNCDLSQVILPATLFADRNGKASVVSGNVPLEELLRRLRKYGAKTVDASQAASASLGGAFQGRSLIHSALAELENRIGSDCEIRLRVDRTGSQQIDLLHGEKWTALQFAGKMGHVSLSTNSQLVPISAIEFGYRLDEGNNLTVDLDPLNFKIPSTQPQVSGAYGIDPITIGATVYSIGSALYQILNPEVDLLLGGNIELVVKLKDRSLDIQFIECPGVRVKAWFEWRLELDRVSISETNIHVAFRPQPRSWFKIKSRDFPVT